MDGQEGIIPAIDRGAGDRRRTRRIVEEAADIVVQAALVSFQWQHIIAAPFEHLGGDAALAVERGGGHDRAFRRQQLQQAELQLLIAQLKLLLPPQPPPRITASAIAQATPL
jgi:hypothetical protein